MIGQFSGPYSPAQTATIKRFFVAKLLRDLYRQISSTYIANKSLRRNPPDVGVTSGQKPCTKIIYIVLQTSVGLFSLSSQNNSFLATPNVENEC